MGNEDDTNAKVPVAYLIDSYRNPYAGTEGQLYQLITHIKAYGFSPSLHLFRASDYLENNSFSCSVETLNIGKMFSLFSIIKLFRFGLRLRRQGVRIVHIFFNDASIIAPIALWCCGLKVLISRRDMGFWYSPAKLKALRVNRFFLAGAIVNSAAVKAITHQKEKIALNKIAVIYNGYDEIEDQEPASAAVQLPWQNNTIVIGLLANIRPIKRIEDAVRAIAKLDRPDVGLLVMGDGDPCDLKLEAKNLGVESQVYFAGPVSNSLQWLSNIDIGILCSESEGFSNTIIEYQQQGKPVVCSSVGGNPEAIEHGKNGYLYPVGEVDTLAKYLNDLIENPSLRRQLGDVGRERVQKDFSIENMCQQHADVYRNLISRFRK